MDVPPNSTDFTLGTPPNSVRFTGGIALTVGNPFAYRSGFYGWAILNQGTVGTVDFDNPASFVSFYAGNLFGGSSVVDVFDQADVHIGSIPITGTNLMLNNSFISFVPGDFGAVEIGKVTVTNLSAGGNQVWIDDFSATVNTPVTMTTTTPDSFTVVRGVLSSGVLSDLFASDDSRLDIRAGLTLFLGESPLQVVFTGTSPTAVPSELRFKLETNANTPGLTQEIQLWNYSTSMYDSLDLSLPGFADGIVEIVITTTPENYIQSGTMEMKAKMIFRTVGLTLLYPWSARTDQAVWATAP